MTSRLQLEVREPEEGPEVAVLRDPEDTEHPLAWLEYEHRRGYLRWHVRQRGSEDTMRAPTLDYVTMLARGDEELIGQITEATRRYKKVAVKQASKLEKSRERGDRITAQQLRNDLRSDNLKITLE
ncbi:MAG TPA: hypothetical protein VEY87_11120 [Gaiellaceae bacterium]|jgi:hypothetical protein|nr:hypothetical protein [Gaiellaceae bacterium]